MKVGHLPTAEAFVPLKERMPGVHIEFVYATPHNFTNEVLYTQPQAYLRRPAADALYRVRQSLLQQGLDIKVWDAYRPWSVTKRMWQVVPDERYAANPAKGSGHNRGISVDLTLIHAGTRQELPMPTGYDNFSDTAHYTFMQLSPEVLANRSLLRKAMEAQGFVALETEWWHFAYVGQGYNYAVQNLSFHQLKRLHTRRPKRP